MRVPLAILISSGALALVAVAVAPEAQAAATPITSCGQTVTTSAVLKQDLVCTGDGVVVGASGITIDLKGFAIRGDQGSGDYGVDDSAGFDHLTVKNGVLRNFYTGVYANGKLISVSNVVASGNAGHGIYVGGDSAKITSSVASGNGADGIRASGKAAKIQLSSASRNVNGGFVVNGDSASIKATTAFGNGSDGIFVSGSSAAIQSSTAAGNGGRGIAVFGSAPSLRGNHANANGFAGGASDLTGLGISAAGFTTAPVGTNTAQGNDDPAECQPASLC